MVVMSHGLMCCSSQVRSDVPSTMIITTTITLAMAMAPCRCSEDQWKLSLQASESSDDVVMSKLQCADGN